MGDPSNVLIGYAGLAYRAPVGEVFPTLINDPFSAGFIDLGLMSEDGLTEGGDRTRTEIRAWGYQSPVRVVKSNQVKTFQATFLETNAYTLSLYHEAEIASMVSSGSGASQSLNFTEGQNPDPVEMALAWDVLDGNRRQRFLIPRCEVSAKGDIVYKGDQAVGYNVTLTTLMAVDGTTLTRMYGGVALPTP